MSNVVSAFTSVFSAIGDWFVTTFGNITDLFYSSENGLTFVGTLAILGVGISVILLIINTVRSWLQLS